MSHALAVSVLEGRRIRLLPLAADHVADLCRVGLAPALWERTTIRVRTADEMAEYVRRALDERAAGTAVPFVIEHREAGVIGTTRFHSIDVPHRHCEIGFTWIATRWQRQGLNLESKYLLLSQAFDQARLERVAFKADVENAASCRALEALGAVREGVLRRSMQSAHRGARDVAVYSVIAPDWPAVRDQLRHRLAFGGRRRAV
jgi:RimJ/RimL family protein N-acetyltransferase